MPTIAQRYAALDFMFILAVKAASKQANAIQLEENEEAKEKLREIYYSGLTVTEAIQAALETVQREALAEFVAGRERVTPSAVIQTVSEASNGSVTLTTETANLLIEAAKAWEKENDAA